MRIDDILRGCLPHRKRAGEDGLDTRTLVIGGAGFIGSNLVHQLLAAGENVTVFDALLRQGAAHNIAWLQSHPQSSRLRLTRADVRDFDAVQVAVSDADVIYHLAGQVAVTTSVTDPRSDFDINALGTLNVLEAARLAGHRPVIVFTSTNKVYGGLEQVAVIEDRHRYRFAEYPNGISEERPLDFHSPYGCSKGAADQYVLDYARIYDLPTVVFRMSCIYGPRQFGTEDQGWVAHFIISALTGRPITIFGNGKQVRDVLFVDDLVRAFRLAVENIGTVAGEVFNIGGGPSNTLSVWSEFGDLLQQLTNEAIPVRFENWRPGDQPCYVSNIEKARSRLGWSPLIDKETGIRCLGEWVRAHPEFFPRHVDPDRPARAGGRRYARGSN
jgi:CDP-paratose 2-epimerase